jgi:hypothetical protein
VDSVHQGDRDGTKSGYHINAVDEVTQWQVVSAVAQTSEAALLPALEAMLEEFPFQIRGFHSDSGSEYINNTVARAPDVWDRAGFNIHGEDRNGIARRLAARNGFETGAVYDICRLNRSERG